MVQAPIYHDGATSHRVVQKARAPSFTSSPLRASSSARQGGSDSESDRSEPIDIPRLAQTSPIFVRPATFTPSSQAGKSWLPAAEALDAPLRAESSLSPPSSSTSYAPKTPPLSSSAAAAIKARRRSSASLLDITAHSPARSSLVGSYEQSLLSGRMSSMPSRPLPFQAEIGILGKGKGKMKMPSHLHLDFGAVFYGEAISSPYVGAIDLEQHYLDELVAARLNALELDRDEMPPSLPRFPGYRLPSPTGQIQLIIKNQTRMPVKLFLIPYDLSDLQSGQKTFIRQKLYFDSGTGPLQYAVHLPFCSPPRTSSARKGAQPRIYLHGTIRVVFHATAVGGPAARSCQTLYDQPEPSDYAGPGEEWAEARRRASLASSPAPFDPDGSIEGVEEEEVPVDAELLFARRPCTPSLSGLSVLSGSRPSTPKIEDALR